MVNRCKWANHNELLKVYHDKEWGLPIHDDKALYECLVLQGTQAGLSWMTILKKRDNYRDAFEKYYTRGYYFFTSRRIFKRRKVKKKIKRR